jgi:DNA-directed RNA polymerase specialized sigma24 family protein
MDSSEKLLIEGCLANEQTAWELFYERFEKTVRDAAGNASWWCRDKANQADEISQQVFVLLCSERGILEALARQGSALTAFLSKLARHCARRSYQREKRRRMEPLGHGEDLPEGLHLDGLDLCRLDEFESRLAPQLRKHFREHGRGDWPQPAAREPATGAERHLRQRLTEEWTKFDRQ